MKLLYKILLFILPFSIVCSCGDNTRRKGMELNNAIEKINDSISVNIELWNKLMAYSVSSGEFGKLKPIRKQLEQLIESGKIKVTNLTDIAGSENFRMAEIDLLTFEKHLVKNDFPQFEKCKYNTPMSTVSLFVEKLQTDKKQYLVLLKKMESCRDSFAEKNKFRFVKLK